MFSNIISKIAVRKNHTILSSILIAFIYASLIISNAMGDDLSLIKAKQDGKTVSTMSASLDIANTNQSESNEGTNNSANSLMNANLIIEIHSNNGCKIQKLPTDDLGIGNKESTLAMVHNGTSIMFALAPVEDGALTANYSKMEITNKDLSGTEHPLITVFSLPVSANFAQQNNNDLMSQLGEEEAAMGAAAENVNAESEDNEFVEADIQYNVCCSGVCHSVVSGIEIHQDGNATFVDPSVSTYLQTDENRTNHINSTVKISDNIVNILRMSLIAFIAGVVINFMPCVLPVLGIKLQALSSYVAGNAAGITTNNGRYLRVNLLFSIFGILATFLSFGMAINVLGRLVNVSAQVATGSAQYSESLMPMWGGYFQNVNFVLFIFVVVFLLYQINRGSISVPVAHLPSKGQNVFHGVVSFAGGVVATLIATPCLAPMFSVAIVFSRGDALITTIVFLSSGIGFALPYILLMFKMNIAKLSKYLNKQKTLKTMYIIIPTFIALTAVWLVYILNGQIGTVPAVIIFAVSIFASWIIGKLASKAIKWGIVLAFICAIFFIGNEGLKSFEQNKRTKISWQELSMSQIDDDILNDKVVLVSVTADWCVLCKINNFMALGRPSFKNFIQRNQVVLMEADVTNKDKYVERYLKEIGVSGVPVLVLYSAKNPSGRVLDIIVTEPYLEGEIENEFKGMSAGKIAAASKTIKKKAEVGSEEYNAQQKAGKAKSKSNKKKAKKSKPKKSIY